ncbi:hypothetical protein [Clostridium weizhouense]|uniref:Uncharacterized protein n=1 Tax=Clostridium weizhouense TaxID=2859781 RepID=A0ABS7AIH1_9CLOT|nr:hypothetical protein [Clostridium weizhouense]MBW6408475.1 hypothetical protein [Clostridium weizhouense]
MDISKFNEKFNKVEGNTYVVEEKIDVRDGIYENELAHDNINIKTVNIYTGSKLTGDKIETYSISTPSLTPWKNIIKIFSKVTPLYISYETIGDQVEADDINKLQYSVVNTQENLNYEIDRAKLAEKTLSDNLSNETKRAKDAENILINNIIKETKRATDSENNIYKELHDEVLRATNSESSIIKNLNAEINRAKSCEKDLTDNLEIESNRAKNSEEGLNNSINNEIIRAKKEEERLANSINTTNTDLSNEVNRSKDTENIISNSIRDEVKRAISAEKVLTDNLNVESNRAKFSEKILTENLNTEISRATKSEESINANLTEEINRSKAVEKSLTENINNTTNSLNSEISRAKSVENDITSKFNEEVNRSKTKENSIEGSLNNYKTTNNAEMQKLREKDIELQDKKSDKTYVDAELNKRYTKDQTFTKEEVLKKIKDVIGTAPEALDTLQEIAKALNNDANFAGTMTKQLATKVDKIQGKQLTDENYTLVDKKKLAKIESEANKYIHPANHSADMIIDNANKRFTTDNERANNLEAYNKRHEHSNKSIIDKITQVLLDNWNAAYAHINDAIKHVTGNERENWNESYKHISDSVKHITNDERKKWNDVDNKLDKNNNAVSASKLASARIITLKGLLSGKADFDGSRDININVSLNPTELTNQSLDSILTVGLYYAGGGNTCANKPNGVDAFGMEVVRSANGWYTQVLYASNGQEKVYFRYYTGNQWSIWSEVYTSSNKPSKTDVGLGNVDNTNDLDKPISKATKNALDGKANNSHTHIKSQITDFPNKISQFTNDIGFITQKDVDISQNHMHTNKNVLDKINQMSVDTWNTISNKADKKHKHSISEIENMPSSLPANGGTASRIYGSMASNDFIRIEGQGNNDNGSLEIATADNGNEPIYVRQYTGNFANISRTLTLLDGNGNTVCPGTLNANELQVKGANVYTTNRKPTPAEIGAMKKGPIIWNDLKGV